MTTVEPTKPKLFLGREPAQWLQLASGVLVLLTPFLHLSQDLNGAILAVLTAVFGLLTALAVSKEKAAPLVAGLLKALIALALALRLNLSIEVQSGVMVFVEAGVAWYLRTQVFAPPAKDALTPVAAVRD
jgi:nicotinamide riboside transporter PnuC